MIVGMLTAMRSEYERQEREARYMHAVLTHVEQIVEHRLDPASIDISGYVEFGSTQTAAPGTTDQPDEPGDLDPGGTTASVPSGPVPRDGGAGATVAHNPTRDELLAWVAAQPGWVRRGDAHTALGGSAKAVGSKLQRLAREGVLESTGSMSHRAYRVPHVIAQAPRRHLCAGPNDLLALVKEHAPVSSERLRELTGRSYPDIADWGHELACRGTVTFEGEGRARTWRPAPSRDDASEIAATIAVHPQELTEAQIALATRIPLERVAIACAELLDRRAVELTARGTYVVVES